MARPIRPAQASAEARTNAIAMKMKVVLVKTPLPVHVTNRPRALAELTPEIPFVSVPRDITAGASDLSDVHVRETVSPHEQFIQIKCIAYRW